MKIVALSAIARWFGVGVLVGLAAVLILYVVLFCVWMVWAWNGRYDKFEKKGRRAKHGRR